MRVWAWMGAQKARALKMGARNWAREGGAAFCAVVGLPMALLWGMSKMAPWLGAWAFDAPKVQAIDTGAASARQWELAARAEATGCLKAALSQSRHGEWVVLGSDCESKALESAQEQMREDVGRGGLIGEGQERAWIEALMARRIAMGEGRDEAAIGALKQVNAQYAKERELGRAREQSWRERQEAAMAVTSALLSRRQVEVPKAALVAAMSPVAAWGWTSQRWERASAVERWAQSGPMRSAMLVRGAGAVLMGLLALMGAVAGLLALGKLGPWMRSGWGSAKASMDQAREAMRPQWERRELEEDIVAGREGPEKKRL